MVSCNVLYLSPKERNKCSGPVTCFKIRQLSYYLVVAESNDPFEARETERKIEVNETYAGGFRKSKRGDGVADKWITLVAAECRDQAF